MRILISGATGFVGSELCKRLAAKGHSLIILSGRTILPVDLANLASGTIFWDRSYTIRNTGLLPGIDAVIHLAGAGVADKRWNVAYKHEILRSRTESTEAILAAFKKVDHFPAVFVSASATGFYGNRIDEILSEDSPKGTGFLSDVCDEWEKAAGCSEIYGSRWVSIRTGIVLSSKGGALPRLLLPYYLFAGGPLGSGQQWFSWISLSDICGAFEAALENESMHGIYNGVAPEPLRMNELSRLIGRILHRPAIFPVPGFILRLVLGESAFEITKSQRVVPARLMAGHFPFRYPDAPSALKAIISNGL